MTQTDQMQQDLKFVRDAVARRGILDRTPQAIAWLWAIFILLSFALLDFRFSAAMWMFAVGAPLCGIVSFLIGRNVARHEGEFDHRVGFTCALHWGTIFLAMIALCFLAAAGRVSGQGIGQVATLVVGVVYFLAGVHFDRRWMTSGLLLMAGAAAISWIPHYPWTSLGAVVCLALILPTFFGKTVNERQGR